MKNDLIKQAEALNEAELQSTRVAATAKLLREKAEALTKHEQVISGLDSNIKDVSEMTNINRLKSIANSDRY